MLETSVVQANSNTCLVCQHYSFHAKKSLDREKKFSLAFRVVSLLSCLSRLAPSVTRLVICSSPAFCSTDQEKRETARSLRACLHGVGDPGLVGLVSFVFTLWGTQNKRNLPH